jgi:hypothetical protein
MIDPRGVYMVDEILIITAALLPFGVLTVYVAYKIFQVVVREIFETAMEMYQIAKQAYSCLTKKSFSSRT